MTLSSQIASLEIPSMNAFAATVPSSGASPTGNTEISNADLEGSALQLVSFAIGNEQYGVNIMAVREIKGWTDITPLPGQAQYVRGVLNLRGSIVPIMDLRCRFGQGQTQATPLHIVIIVQIGEKPMGLLADRVLDIVSLEPSDIRPIPKVSESQGLDHLSGLAAIESGMVALIDLESLQGSDPVELS